jgi:hypothetical protein
MYLRNKDASNSTAIIRLWRTDQQDRDGKPKLLQQIPVFAKKVSRTTLDRIPYT